MEDPQKQLPAADLRYQQRASYALVSEANLDFYLLARLYRAGADAKWRIQRTKTHQAGQYKHSGQDHEHDAQGTRNGACEIKKGYDGSNDDPDQAVGGSHVCFHVVMFSDDTKVRWKENGGSDLSQCRTRD
jgi:hypothetical protein